MSMKYHYEIFQVHIIIVIFYYEKYFNLYLYLFSNI